MKRPVILVVWVAAILGIPVLLSWLALGYWWNPSSSPCLVSSRQSWEGTIQPPWLLPFGTDVIENHGSVCFYPEQSGGQPTGRVQVQVYSSGCYSSGCSLVYDRRGQMYIDPAAMRIQLFSRFAVKRLGSSLLGANCLCTLDCGGAGILKFETEALQKGVYTVYLGDSRLGSLTIPISKDTLFCLHSDHPDPVAAASPAAYPAPLGTLLSTVTPIFNSEYPPPGLPDATDRPAFPVPLQPLPTAQPYPIPILPNAPSIAVPALITQTFPTPETSAANAVYFLDGEKQLWAANLDGSGEKRLWYGAEQAALSPDGQWFSTFRGMEIWLVPVAGGDAVKVFDANPLQGKSLSAPTWSADSRRLLFVQSYAIDMPTPNIIWLFTMGTGEARKLAQFNTGYPVLLAWSPDGKKIAYTRTHELVALEVVGGQQTILTNGECNYLFDALSWSPAGDRISHRHHVNGRFGHGVLCWTSLAGETQQLEPNHHFSMEAWDSSGSALYYLSQNVVYTQPDAQIRGPVLNRYNFDTLQAEELISWETENHGMILDLRLLPDGSRLAYTIENGLALRLRLITLPDLSVAEYDLTGGITGRSFTWSSDGSQIIFSDELSQRLFAFDIVREEIHQISGKHTIKRWWTGTGAR